MTAPPVCVVVGLGPGNGTSLCQRFTDAGYRVAGLARSDRSELLESMHGATAFQCDATDADQVSSVFSRIEEELGPIDTVIYNAGAGVWGGISEIDAKGMERSWQINALGLFHVAHAVAPKMRERGRGGIGVIGATASWRGKPSTLAFAQAKAAQRSIAQSLARELGPEGVHVFYVIVDGVIDIPSTRERMPDKPDEFFLDPDDIASAVLAVRNQPRSAWTFELDLRPFGEEW